MYWDAVSVTPENDFTLRVKFADGLEGIVRFKPSHLTGVFEALKDDTYFKTVHISHGVVTWSDDLDLAPDAMHDAIKKNGEWILS